MANCFDILSREIKDLTPNEVDDLLAELRRRQQSLVAKGIPVDEANAQASKSVQHDLKLAAAIEKRSAAINLRLRRAALDMIRTSFPEDVTQGLESLLVGSKFSAKNSRFGIDQIQDALRRKYVGGLFGDLKRAGMLEVFANGALDLEVAQALRGLDDPAVVAKLPKEAVAIAQIVRRWQESARLDANRAGAWIGKLPDYIVTQAHDADRILRAGFDKWMQTILPRLDMQRMFGDVPVKEGPRDMRAYLKETYDNIVSGVHENLGTGEKMAGFSGPGNLAKRQSHERKLHFKSAEDWFAYNKEFGGGNLRESVVMGLERHAESTGLMRQLGTNPEANLETIVDALRQELKDAGRFDELKKLDTWARGRGEGLYSIISGRSRAAVNASRAAIGSTVRGVQNLSALGGAALAAITDPFIAANSARHEGRSLLGTFADHILAPMKAALDKMSGGERAAALTELNYFGDGLIGRIGSRFSQAEGVHGVMSKMQRWAFGLNLLRPMTDVGRGAALLGTSGRLAKLAESSWKDIGDDMQRLLSRYGIGEREWSLLKDAVYENGSYRIMAPEQVRAMDSRKFTTLAKERINDFKAGLAERIQKRAKQDARESEWVSGRAEKLRDGLAVAGERLNERLAKAEGRNAAAIREVQNSLASLYGKIDTAATFWETGTRGLRKAGVTEGKAREAAKNLKAEARQLGRDLSRLQKELNQEFIAKWQDKEEAFIEFADRVDEQIRGRAEKTEKELTDLDPAIKRILEDAKEEVATRLEALLYDRMNYAIISPAARTEYFQTGGGQQRGTGLGELARTVMQFKSFSIAFWQNAIQQEMYGRGARSIKQMGTAEMIGLTRLILMSTVAGYMAMTAKDWAKGKAARPADNIHTWMASAVQGGGFGIYGDFLFGESNRFGQSAIETLAGPTAGDAADLVDILQSARNGNDPSAKALRFLVNNTPYMNLFYTRLALDHLFLFEIQDQLNPGYLQRMERRMEKETGAEWNIRPTEAIQ